MPCPIKAGEILHKKTADRSKSRMDQRTRERLPILPALIAATDSQRKAAAERLAAAKAAAPGQGRPSLAPHGRTPCFPVFYNRQASHQHQAGRTAPCAYHMNCGS